MKKLLIMASLFWPQKNSGGPPISIMNLISAIKDSFEIYIISNHHEIGETDRLPKIADGWNVFPFGKAWYIPAGEHTSKNVAKLIEEIAPDVIYQNSFFSVNDLLPVLRYKKQHQNVKVIVAPRGELYPERYRKGYVKKKLYSMLFRYSGLLRDVYFQGTGEDECKQEHEILGIGEKYLYNVQNLSLTAGESTAIQKNVGELNLVYIARIHPTKNLLFAIECLAGMTGKVKYDIYGSIEDKAYWELCKRAIAALPKNVTVTYCGVIEHEDVSKTLRAYHAYYMPTTGENFGHSIVEAMLLGRSVIISDQTPWTEVNGHGGYALPLEKQEPYERALRTLCQSGQAEFDGMRAMAKAYIEEKLNVEEIIRQYIAMFDGASTQ